MKAFFAFFAAASLFVACGPQGGAENNEAASADSTETVESAVSMNFYGDTITADGAISAAELTTIVQSDGGFEGKVTTVIHETCQKKGCWMKVDMGEGNDMRVTFKDYGFFVPTGGVEGKEVIMEGLAYMDTTSVEMLRHFAEDAGKSQEEIEAITEPEYNLAFEATGVIIKE